MTGDPREKAEQYLLAKLEALATVSGLPESFRLVTRELVHLADVKPYQLPACFLQFEEPDVLPRLGHAKDVILPGRIVIGFSRSIILPASEANAYRQALETMLEHDVHLGGLVDSIYVSGTLMPGLWGETGLLGLGVLFRMSYEYDARLPALV